MATVRTVLAVFEVLSAILTMAAVLLQSPQSTGLGGTIGGGYSSYRGGYRTRRGLERQLYWTTWVLVGLFLVVSLANIMVSSRGG